MIDTVWIVLAGAVAFLGERSLGSALLCAFGAGIAIASWRIVRILGLMLERQQASLYADEDDVEAVQPQVS